MKTSGWMAALVMAGAVSACGGSSDRETAGTDPNPDTLPLMAGTGGTGPATHCEVVWEARSPENPELIDGYLVNMPIADWVSADQTFEGEHYGIVILGFDPASGVYQRALVATVGGFQLQSNGTAVGDAAAITDLTGSYVDVDSGDLTDGAVSGGFAGAWTGGAEATPSGEGSVTLTLEGTERTLGADAATWSFCYEDDSPENP